MRAPIQDVKTYTEPIHKQTNQVEHYTNTPWHIGRKYSRQ